MKPADVSLVISVWNRKDDLRENLAAARLVLSSDDMREIAALDRARRYISGTTWAMAGSTYTLANLWDA